MLQVLEQLDHRLFFLINKGLGRHELDAFFGDLSTLGGWTIALVTLAALAADGRRVFARHLLVLIAAIAIFAPVNRLLKTSIGRERPIRTFAEQIEQDPDYVRMVSRRDLSRNAFPSGHSAFAFFIMHYLALAKRPYRFAAWTLAALAAFSRIYVGVHYPADCLAGAGLGLLSGWLAWQAYRNWFAPAQPPPTEERAKRGMRAET